MGGAVGIIAPFTMTTVHQKLNKQVIYTVNQSACCEMTYLNRLCRFFTAVSNVGSNPGIYFLFFGLMGANIHSLTLRRLSKICY